MKKSILLLVGIALILSACNLPFGSGVAPAMQVLPLATMEFPPTPAQAPEPLIPENPTIGSTISWFDTSTLVYVPGGEFIMGADEPKKQDFNPAHPVSVKGFWIYSTKVTNEMYNLCVSLGQCSPVASNSNEPSSTMAGTALISFVTGPDGAEYALKDLPATNVTWDQAANYCKWAGGRLPTEAEWEKTARGEESKILPWGDETPTCDLLNFGECGGFLSNVLDYPDGISDYMALDMAGNAYEWVNDWYQKDYYAQSPSVSPIGPVDGEKRSVRGSSFGSEGEQVPSYIRNSLEPDQYRLDVGFRCVIEDPAVFAPICEAPAVIFDSVPQPGQPVTSDSGSSVNVITYDFPTKYANYCANRSANLGGANITVDWGSFVLAGKANPDLVCNKWGVGFFLLNSQGDREFITNKNIQGYAEILSGDPFIIRYTMWGPEDTTIYMSPYTDCYVKQPILPPTKNVPANCEVGYALQANGLCLYTGAIGKLASVSCPGGYYYNSETQCCTQNPQHVGGQPSLYPACGPGNIFDPQQKVCYKPGTSTSTFVPVSVAHQFKLGTCEEPKPKDSDKPSQPQQPEPTPCVIDPATGACH